MLKFKNILKTFDLSHCIIFKYIPAPFPGSVLLVVVTIGTGSFPLAPFEALLISDISISSNTNE